MAKKRPSDRKPHQAAKPHGAGSDSRKRQDRRASPPAESGWLHAPSPAAIRETIESVVIAFVLAFLFRTFEAEAFVIPTGSMAPTLMGRHKDLECPICGYAYRVSASDEVDSNSNVLNGNWVEECTCPMCRYTMHLGDGRLAEENYPSFKGDRILVGKFCYQFGEPQRWDVAVFKYPGGAQTNFIKRLVGLPNEMLRISHGDVSTSPRVDPDEEPSVPQWTIARKPPAKLLAMLQPVFDQAAMPKLVEEGWAARWRPQPSSEGLPSVGHSNAPPNGRAGAWQASEDYRSFHSDGRAAGEVWLRYEHRVPSREEWFEWDDLVRKRSTPQLDPEPQLISDFCTYNTSRGAGERTFYPTTRGLHWVGDLALMGRLEVQSDSGQAIFELVEGGWHMRCRIDVATGTAALSMESEDPGASGARTIDGEPYQLTAQTDVRGPGQYEIIFSNVDDQLRLWVNGSVVPFGASDAATCYAPLHNTQPQQSDLSPVGIGSSGAALRVSQLKILRDIYYIADGAGPYAGAAPAITDLKPLPVRRDRVISDVISDPTLWDAFEDTKQRVFELEPDQFLALGDNSAKSKDSRLWGLENIEHYVSRRLLIGKALYIYWPHSWDKLPGTNIPFPFFPNFPRMGLVR